MLVHGGAGGVGHIAVQVAVAHGAEVFATGAARNCKVIEQLGATAIDYEAEQVADYVQRYTGGEGFDLIFDSVGGSTLDASFEAVRRFGHVVSAFGWGSHSLAPLSFKGATYSGVFTLHPLLTGVGREHHGDILRAAARLVEDGKLMPILDPRRFTLDSARDGYTLPEILQRIEQQSGVPAASFRSEHMGHPLCNAMSFVFAVNGRLEPLFKYISRDDLLAFLGDDRRDTLLGLFAGKRAFFTRYLCKPEAWRLIAKAAPIFGYNPLNVLRTPHLLLFAKSFMERDGLDPERVHACAYGITDTAGVYSFCAFNNLYRFPDRA